MPLLRREAVTVINDFICETCNKGLMFSTHHPRKGIDPNKKYWLHKCSNPKCGKTAEFEVEFPKVEHIPVDIYQKMIEEQEKKAKERKDQPKPEQKKDGDGKVIEFPDKDKE